MSLLKIFHPVQTKLQNICGLNAERKARDYSGCGALNISVQRKVGVARAGQAPRTDKYLRSQLGGLTLQSSPASRAEISHQITLILSQEPLEEMFGGYREVHLSYFSIEAIFRSE